MAKTKIEWCNYSLNPVKGLCPMGCSYCYARRMYKRFRWNPEIRFDESVLTQTLYHTKPGDKIFVGSTMELFGDWVKIDWWIRILDYVSMYPSRSFIFLTKKPENLIEWSPFPKNCWVGVSAVDMIHFYAACHYLADIKAQSKFISFEPLLESIDGAQPIEEHLQNAGIDWVIIGQQTPISKKTEPKIGWIQEILVAASNAGNIPVFMKNNLQSLLVSEWAGWKLRQEFPKEVNQQ